MENDPRITLELTSTNTPKGKEKRPEIEWHEEARFASLADAVQRGRELFMKCACDAWRVVVREDSPPLD